MIVALTGSLLILTQIICIQSAVSTNGFDDQTINIISGYESTRRLSAKVHNADTKLVKLFAKLAANSTERLVGVKATAFMTNEENPEASYMNGGTPESYNSQQASVVALSAYRDYRESSNYNSDDLYRMPDRQCYSESKNFYCDKLYPWRTMDGSCNNPNWPWWGAAKTPYQRMAAPAYNDGVNSPRAYAKDGSYLTNPRKIAIYVHSPYKSKSPWSHLYVWFGQFIMHDVTKVASTVYSKGEQKYCRCGSPDPECFSIPIPYEDYWNKDQQCMSFTRSAAAARYFDCYLGPREQLNLQSSFVDLDHIYGNSYSTSKKVRSFKNGLLRVSYDKYTKQELLPFLDGLHTCMGLKPKQKCAFAGDSRHEDNGYLNALSTLWVREHNRVARKLWKLNPSWSDELTFQEARKVVIAEYQNIVYAEFLPLLVGQKVARQFDLLPSYDGYFMGYDQYLFGNTYNEFSFAARYGHTLVKNYQVRADLDYHMYSNKTTGYYIFNQELPSYNGGIDSLLRGGIVDYSYATTSQVNDEMNNWLFEGNYYKETGTKRFSLPALNIQRGRDHAVAPYTVYRDLCGLGRAYSFDDLTNIPRDVVNQLRKVYKSVEDIDLWTGMVSEYPLKDATVGATQACILAKGFRDWKYGDRWWFENGNEAQIRFTPGQLNEIKKSSMARILCDNSDLKFVQKLTMLYPNEEYNQYTDCQNILMVDLNLWAEQKDYKPYQGEMKYENKY
jgi:hypothetical protein